VWFNAAERTNLLPALQAMHDLVAQPGRREFNPDQPNWEDECRLLGVTPEMVRQWKCRTAAETDIRHLLGEGDKPPGKKDSRTARNAQAVKHLYTLVTAVSDGDDKQVEKLAAAFAEYYGF
jgi:hypothetical protein